MEEWLFITTSTGTEKDMSLPQFNDEWRKRSNDQSPILMGKTRKEVDMAAEDVLNNISAGVAPMGNISGNYIGGQEPVLATMGLPLIYTKEQYKPIIEATWDIYEDLLAGYGLKLLYTGDKPNVFWSAIPIESPNDISKMKFRSSAKTVSDTMAGLGAKAIVLPAADIYTSMSTGLVNCFTFGPLSGMAYKFNEVCEYIYLGPIFNGNTYYGVIREEAFNSLTPEVQNALMETAEALKWNSWENEFPTPEDEALQRETMTVVEELDPDLVLYIRDNGAKAAWQEWALKSPAVQEQMDIIFDIAGISYK
jgi:TRAP-type C4-dicarboxylate transport system substrate-binding protein